MRRRPAGREEAGIVKRVSIVRRREGLTHEQFADYWLGPHAELARGIPGARGYVINVAQEPEAAGCDGFAEVWFDSEEAARTAFSEEPFASVIAADRPKFVGDQTIFLVDEHAVIPPP